MVTLPESHTSPQKLASGADGVLGTKVVTTGPWCLERVRLFEFTGELEDYDELEQLEAACAPEESNNESDYTSSTDEEDFETTRSRQIEELRQFSNNLSKMRLQQSPEAAAESSC